MGGVGYGMAECFGKWNEKLRKFQGGWERDKESEKWLRKRREKRWAR